MAGDDLLAWSLGLPDWECDALRRIAITETLSDEDQDAVRKRLRHAHGIAVEGDTVCVPLDATHLPVAADAANPTLLCGIGPAQNVNNLADDQELRFALDGITLIYGDNGSGKSGFARIAKKLCQARVVDDLLGNVFAEQAQPAAEVRVRFQPPGAAAPLTENWRDGMPRPAALARLSVLDEACARVYIDRQNEITFLPREIEILARLGDLFTTVSAEIQREMAAIEQRYRGIFGLGYANGTAASRLVRSLVMETALPDLPTEAALREAAVWDQAKQTELDELHAALARDPRTQAAAHRRAAAALTACADDLEPAIAALRDPTVAALRGAIEHAAATAAAAELSADEAFAAEPLPHTGQAAWRLMYTYARAFAEEAGAARLDQAFAMNDPCPLCQSPLDAEAAERMRRFDDFIKSKATEEAESARGALQILVEGIEAAELPAPAALDRNFAEYATFGPACSQLAARVLAYLAEVQARKTAMIAGAGEGRLLDVEALPASPVGELRGEAARLTAEANALDVQPAGDPALASWAAELRDAKRLSQERDAMLTRRSDLELRRRLLNCKEALDTRPVSLFARRLRQELVTPELRDRIMAEIFRFDLSHLPLRFEDATDEGRSLFDIALDTRRQHRKSAVLSEGEQRALGISCFLAEIGRVEGNHGIIVDDPVSSLDHQRIRKVAERLVEEAARGRQVIIFTHNLIFYQEVLGAAVEHKPQVPTLSTVITRAPGGKFGLVTEADEPWIAKKVAARIEALRQRLGQVPPDMNRDTDEYRRLAKDFYTDLRESWERLVEEVLLAGVVERFNAGVKTQSLKGVVVEDEDYRVIFAAMKRVSQHSGHDMAPGRQIPVPDTAEMRRDIEAIEQYRQQINSRKRRLEEARRALEEPPPAQIA